MHEARLSEWTVTDTDGGSGRPILKATMPSVLSRKVLPLSRRHQ
jgi:hypothetical protein